MSVEDLTKKSERATGGSALSLKNGPHQVSLPGPKSQHRTLMPPTVCKELDIDNAKDVTQGLCRRPIAFHNRCSLLSTDEYQQKKEPGC